MADSDNPWGGIGRVEDTSAPEITPPRPEVDGDNPWGTIGRVAPPIVPPSSSGVGIAAPSIVGETPIPSLQSFMAQVDSTRPTSIVPSPLADSPQYPLTTLRPSTPEGGDTERRYQGIGGLRRGLAGVRNILEAVPVVRHIPGISALASDADLQLSREARPGLSMAERGFGHSIPYGFAPMATLPSAMASGAAIEGLDTAILRALAGDTPGQMLGATATSGVRGALQTVPGHLATRFITPRLASATSARQAGIGQDLTQRAERAAREEMDTMQALGVPTNMSEYLSSFLGIRKILEAQQRASENPLTRYFNNQLLSDEARAILTALMAGGSHEITPEGLTDLGTRLTPMLPRLGN